MEYDWGGYFLLVFFNFLPDWNKKASFKILFDVLLTALNDHSVSVKKKNSFLEFVLIKKILLNYFRMIKNLLYF